MMLRSHRRYFVVLAFALLAAPLVVGFAWPDSPELVYAEGRRLAPAPSLPESADGLAALPGQIDAWLDDRFGLRHAMIKLHRDLSHPVLLKVNTAALVGRDGRMFYEADDMVRQSAGLTVRDRRVADAADLIARMRDDLARRGIRFLVAVPPNASTVYQDALPRWAQRQGRRTEYDILLDALAGRGVKAVDLRPALEAARDDGAPIFCTTRTGRRAAPSPGSTPSSRPTAIPTGGSTPRPRSALRRSSTAATSPAFSASRTRSARRRRASSFRRAGPTARSSPLPCPTTSSRPAAKVQP